MKKYLFSLIFIFTSLTSFAFDQTDLIHILQKPENIQGQFEQQRYLKSLTKPIISQGQFTLVKNNGLLWKMEKPFASLLRVNSSGIMQWNGTAWIENNKLGQSEQIKLFLGLLSGDISTLEQQFNLKLIGSEKNWQLVLTPSSLLMKQIFTQIEIQGSSQVEQIELNEVQGDKIKLLFSQLKINQPLNQMDQSLLK